MNALVGHGANVNAREASQNQTALMWAVAREQSRSHFSALPHQNGRFRTLVDLVGGRATDAIEDGQGHVLDAELLGQCLELGLIGVGIVAEDNDKRLQLARLVLANCCIDLLDQTGQVVRDRACKNADRGTVAIESAIAEFFSGVRAGDVLDVERLDTLAGTQPGLHICCFRHGHRHD